MKKFIIKKPIRTTKTYRFDNENIAFLEAIAKQQKVSISEVINYIIWEAQIHNA